MATLKNSHKKDMLLAGGIGMGAAVMYLLDPASGKHRRALARDKAVHAFEELRTGAAAGVKDATNRIVGIVAEVTSARHAEPVADDVLTSRIRAKLGHIINCPNLLEVRVQDGMVNLSGDILHSEADELVATVRSVPGVVEVVNRMQAWKDLTDIPGVRPETLRRRPGGAMGGYWSPSARLLAGMAGSLLTVYGVRRGGFLGFLTSGVGAVMVGRGISNKGVGDLVGMRQDGIFIQKTVTVDAPVSDLFDFWADPENYPRVMSHVQEVRRVGANRYHWKVVGPGGTTVEWEGTITRVVPNELVAWKSLPGSLIPNSGVVRVDPNYDATTRVHIRMSYQPPAGALGHFVAELFGADPKSALDEDLVRLKSLFERGKTKVHRRTVSLEQIRQT